MRSVSCASCGLVGWADAGNCKRCGQPLPAVNRQAPPKAAPPPPPPPRQDYRADYEYAPPRHDYFAAPEKKRNGRAVASLVMGVVGLFTLGLFLIGSVVGMFLGIAAIRKENSEPSVYGGKGFAIAGIVVNVVALLTVVPASVILAVAVPNFYAARRAANEAFAVGTLKALVRAEDTYRATAGAGKFGDINQLAAAGLIDKQLLSGPKHDYVFNVTVSQEGDFNVRATPSGDSSNSRSFCVRSSSLERIYYNNGGQPSSCSGPWLDSSGRPAQPQVITLPAGGPAYGR